MDVLTLHVSLLGTFRLVYGDRLITSVNTRQLQTLLAYLVLHGDRSHSRKQLASLLYPDCNDTESRTRLRQSLYRLQQVFPESSSLLTVDTGTVGLQTSAVYHCDVSLFQHAAQQAQASPSKTLLERAVSLYTGDLLPDYEDEWIRSERDRLQQTYSQLLTQFVQVLKNQQDYAAAIPYARRLIELDRLNESAYAQLIQLYGLNGDRAHALFTYQQCETILQEELGIDPSSATQEIYEAIKNSGSPGERVDEPKSRDATPLVAQGEIELEIQRCIDWNNAPDVNLFYGRTVEQMMLQQWMERDRCRLIAVLGMGGIGKTALAVKVAQELVESNQERQQAERFQFVVWRSLRNAPPLETLLSDIIPFLSNQQDIDTRLSRLIYWLQRSRCLIILDNMETILQEGAQTGQFRSGYEDYGELLRLVAEVSHQSCVMLTSREKPTEVGMFEGMELTVRSLLLSGSAEAAHAILDAKGLTGTSEEKQTLCQLYSNNLLALKLVSSSIQELLNADIASFLEQNTVIFQNIRRLLDQQFNRLTELEQIVMYWLAINREWTTVAELAADIIPSVAKSRVLEALESLRWRSLIEKSVKGFTQQSVVMEYVTDHLVKQICDEIITGRVRLLSSHALLKSTAQDYVRASQARLILAQIFEQLRVKSKTPPKLAATIRQLLTTLRQVPIHRKGYGGGNVLNLCCNSPNSNTDLTGYDFSALAIRYAYLQDAQLHQVSFAHAEFVKTLFTQTFSSILSVAVSPDGQLLATGDTNAEVRLWHVADGQLLYTLEGHADWVRSVAFHPQGHLLASGCDEHTIFLWDVQTGNHLMTLAGHTGRVCSVVFSPDGAILASSSEDCTLRLWNSETGECIKVLEGHTQQVWSVGFHPDGTRVASGGEDQLIKIWDVQSGQCIKTIEGHTNWICTVAFSPDGLFLASGSHDATVRLWDASTGNCVLALNGHRSWIWSVAFNPQGTILASGSEDQTVRLWHVPSGQCVKVLEGHTHRIWSVAFAMQRPWVIEEFAEHSSVQSLLISGGDDQTVRLWRIEAVMHDPSHSDSEMFQSSKFVPLFNAREDLSQPLHIISGYCVRTLKGCSRQIWSISCNPDGRTIATSGDEQTIRLWDISTGRCERVLEGHTHRVSSVAFSADGSFLASGGEDQTVRIWDVHTGAVFETLKGHTKQVWCVVFSPDEQLLASGSEDQTIRLWNAATGECLKTLEGHRNWVWAIAFSPDGQWLASGSYDQTVKLWDAQTGACIRTLEGHSGSVLSVAFSPDGELLATGSPYDQTIRVWSPKTGQCLKVLLGEAPMTLAFAPAQQPHRKSTGHTLASGNLDSTIKLWDLETGTCSGVLEGHNRWIFDLAFSLNSQILVSGSGDETTRVWKVDTGACLQVLRPNRPYEGMNITGITGLTEAQKIALKALGAVET